MLAAERWPFRGRTRYALRPPRSWASRRTRRGPQRTLSARRSPARPLLCSTPVLVRRLLSLVRWPLADNESLFSVGEYWAGKAFGTSDNRGKMLRRDGFTLAEERYGACCVPYLATLLRTSWT